MNSFPKIESVYPLPNYHLLVLFENGKMSTYDCRPLRADATCEPLVEESLFAQVHVDDGGYGVVWTDEIDLAESELWLNGHEAENLPLKALLSLEKTT